MVVRATLPLESLIPAMRTALREMDPRMPTGEYQTLGAIVDRAASPRRFIVSLIGAFAVAAALLASLGIYGVISYSVARRTTEIGIRMALGATRRDVTLRVLREALSLAGLGLFIGVPLVLYAARFAETQGMLPEGTTPYGTLAMATALLAVAALLAALAPAARASAVDPIDALRS